MYLIASETVAIFSAASSGISTPNSSSKAIDQLDNVEAVGTEIVDEACVLVDLVGLDPEVLDNDLLHAVGGIAHSFAPSRNWVGLSKIWPSP